MSVIKIQFNCARLRDADILRRICWPLVSPDWGPKFSLPSYGFAVICRIVSTHNEFSNEELAAKPNCAGFGLLYERNSAHLLAYLTRLAGQTHAADLSQEAWIRVHKSLPKAFTADGFKSWLFSIARKLNIDRTRKKKPGELNVDPVDDRSNIVEDVLDEERHALLRVCLEKLRRDNLRSAEVVTRLLAGVDVGDICKEANLNPQQVYKIKFETIKILQICVSKERV